MFMAHSVSYIIIKLSWSDFFLATVSCLDDMGYSMDTKSDE